MARPRTATLYESGPVRVTTSRSGYRLRWMELGTERERSISTRVEAERTADAIAGRLALAGAGGVSGATAYGALADAWVERYRPDWGAGHLKNVTSVLDGHILPAVGRLSCDRVTDTDLNRVAVAMLEAGYSTDWRAHTVRTMRSLGRWGVSRGVWISVTDPAARLSVPSSDEQGVDQTLIPSATLIAELAAAVVAQAPTPEQALRRRWMLAAASGTGLRFSEMTALWPEHIDLGTREVRVVQAWVRQASGPPVLGPPKSKHGRRTVVIPADDVDLWAELLEITEERRHLGTSLRGAVWRSPGWKQRVWDDATASVEGWPARAGLHYLRHYAITQWLERGVPIGDVSRLAGHHDAAFTMKRYVGPATDHLDQARDLL